MYLCRKLLRMPYMKIGDFFSRDHSTVMTAVRSVKKKEDEPTIRSDLARLEAELATRYRKG